MAHQSQAEAEPGMRAGARAVPLMEALEEMGQLLLGDSLSGVADDDLDMRIGTLQMDLHSTALRREFHGVDQEVPDHLLQPVRVAGDPDGAGVQHALKPYLLRVGGRPHRVDCCPDDRLEVDRAYVEAHLPRDDA